MPLVEKKFLPTNSNTKACRAYKTPSLIHTYLIIVCADTSWPYCLYIYTLSSGFLAFILQKVPEFSFLAQGKGFMYCETEFFEVTTNCEATSCSWFNLCLNLALMIYVVIPFNLDIK